jgi:hypothetical protein
LSSCFIADPSVVERTWQKTLHKSLHKLQPEKFKFKFKNLNKRPEAFRRKHVCNQG